MKPGLERMQAGIEKLGLSRNPEGRVHVVGTNGKGSSVAFLESIARAHGRTTGTFISPHFITPRERIRINGEMLTEGEWIALANRVYTTCPEIDFSYFELLTLIAMLAFEYAGVDMAIFEAGLGGTWDATSAFPHELTIMTPIGLDHETILGPDLATIAADKSGAITGGHVLCGRQDHDVVKIITSRAKAQGATLHLQDMHTSMRDGHPLFRHNGHELLVSPDTLGLKGPFQQDNAMLALLGWSIFTADKGWPFLPLKCKEGLARVQHPGRMQFIQGSPAFWLDGAHNQMGLQALEASLQAIHVIPDCMIFSCMEDKNILQCLEQVKRLCPRGHILVPQITDNERAVDAGHLATLLGDRAQACVNMETALNQVAGQEITVLICGSLYLLGEFFRIRPDGLALA